MQPMYTIIHGKCLRLHSRDEWLTRIPFDPFGIAVIDYLRNRASSPSREKPPTRTPQPGLLQDFDPLLSLVNFVWVNEGVSFHSRGKRPPL